MNKLLKRVPCRLQRGPTRQRTVTICLFLFGLASPVITGGYSNNRILKDAERKSALDVRWIHGAADCSACTDPPLQVYQFDSETFILRESKCLNFEGPFLYLLIGHSKALLLDSGAEPRKGQTLPVREVVEKILSDWQQASRHRTGIELIVAHSHSHRDHKFGDS